MKKVAESVRDDLVAQDLRVRRVSAKLERDIEVRLKRLELDVADLVASSDLAGQRKVQALEKKVKELTDLAYADIDAMVDAILSRIAVAEAKAVAKILEKAIL